MANICRLCGNIKYHTIFIFGNEALKHDIDLKIRAGLDIQLFRNDPLPKHACDVCLGKLDEFWNFQNHCRRVQTNLRRLLLERVPLQFQNINCDQYQSSKTNTEESSARFEVLKTLGDSTDNIIKHSGDLNSDNFVKVDVDEVKVEAHSHENSNDSFHSINESCGNECEPCENDPYLIDTDLLVSTQNETSVAAGQLDSDFQDREENMAVHTAGETSETAPEDNPVTVEGESEVQDNLVSEEADTTNTILRRCGTHLSVNNNNNINSLLFSDRSQDSLLMEVRTLGVPNSVRSTTSVLTAAEKATEDNICKDILLVNNDFNLNSLLAPNRIPQSSHNLTTTNKIHHGTKSTDTCSYVINISESSLLKKEQPLKNRNNLSDDIQDVSTEVVNNGTNNEKEFACPSVINRLRDVLLKKDLSLNHPNLIGIGTTNVFSGFVTSQKKSSSDSNPGHLLGKECKTISQLTGKSTRNSEFDLFGLSSNRDSQPLQVMHSDAETTLIEEENVKISGKVSILNGSVPVTGENEVQQTLRLNPSAHSVSNTSHESHGHTMTVISGNSATCVTGIDVTMCVNRQYCISHPFDKYWNNVGSHFRCLLCEFVTDHRSKIRDHSSAHASLKLFECSICYKKLSSDKNLTLHMKIHSRKDDGRSSRVHGVYSCENCSKTFKCKSYLREHQIKICGIGSVSCPDCGLRFSSLQRHKFNCPGKTGFICDFCDKTFMDKCVLRKHLRSHEQGEFVCDKCQKVCSTSSQLRSHQNAVHGTGKYKCTYCTKSFFSKQRLEVHVVCHTGIRNYLCDICSKSFLNASNLATHIKFHGKRDFKCYLCGKMYFRKNMLQSHMKNVHCK